MAKDDKQAQPSGGLDAIINFINQSSQGLGVAGANAPQTLGPGPQFYANQQKFLAEQGAPRDPTFVPYNSDEVWVPGYAINRDDRARLKARMNAVGLYGTTGYKPGSWTDEDARAYQTVLEAANAMGVRDANVVIDNLGEDAKAGARVQGPRAPLVSNISNPDTIRSVLRETAYSLTGSRLSEAEEQSLIAAYQGQQQASQQANYAAGGTGGPGGTVVDAATLQGFAEGQIEKMRPGDVAAHRHLDAFEKILGSMGTLASETPTYGGEGLPKTTGAEVL